MSPQNATTPTRSLRLSARGGAIEQHESVIVEAPLHLKLNGVAYTTTMRTPGDDEPLARGLLFTEGIVSNPHVTPAYRAIPDPESGLTACLEITLPDDQIEKSVEGRRTLFASASCGVCGTREPSEIAIYGPPLRLREQARLDPRKISGMRERMRASQAAFSETGGCHAAAIFDGDGNVLALKEDVGRHNAVDKAVGTLLHEGRLGDAAALFVSGRVSYEIVYKAYRAGIPFVLAVSAPSSMAIETAERLGMSVIGFCRDGRATVYSNAHNVSIATEGVQ